MTPLDKVTIQTTCHLCVQYEPLMDLHYLIIAWKRILNGFLLTLEHSHYISLGYKLMSIPSTNPRIFPSQSYSLDKNFFYQCLWSYNNRTWQDFFKVWASKDTLIQRYIYVYNQEKYFQLEFKIWLRMEVSWKPCPLPRVICHEQIEI